MFLINVSFTSVIKQKEGCFMKRMQYLNQYLLIMIYSVLAIIYSFIIYQNIMLISEEQLKLQFLIYGILILCILLFIGWNYYKPQDHWILIMILFIGFFLRLLYVFAVDTPPASDYLKLYRAANAYLNNDNSWLKDSYFQLWDYQIPFVLYEAFILNLYNYNFVICLK